MGIRMKSLCEDSVDSVTHTWSVVLFLILAALLLVVPVTQNPPTKPNDSKSKSVENYEAICWCPAQFVESHVRYTNKVCTTILSKKFKQARYKRSSKNVNQTNRKDNELGEEKEEIKMTTSSRVNSPPVLLLLLAIGLRLPKILMSIFCQCAGSFNVEETLESVQKVEVMDRDKRQELYKEMITPLMSPWSSRVFKSYSTFYTLMKVLFVCVIIVEIVVVTNHAIPEIEEQNQPPTTNDAIHSCFFQIRRFHEVHEFSVQCLYEPIEKHQNRLTLDTYKFTQTCLTSVLAALYSLFVINALNTILWCFTFFCGCVPNNDTPQDVKFLLCMAKANLSTSVVHCLSGIVSSKSTRLEHEMPLKM